MNTEAISTIIYNRLKDEKELLSKQFKESKEGIGYFFIDNLLPLDLAKKIDEVFPKKEEMVLKKSLREFKYVAAQMDQYDSLLEKVVYAFQDERIVKIVGASSALTQTFMTPICLLALDIKRTDL